MCVYIQTIFFFDFIVYGLIYYSVLCAFNEGINLFSLIQAYLLKKLGIHSFECQNLGELYGGFFVRIWSSVF